MGEMVVGPPGAVSWSQRVPQQEAGTVKGSGSSGVNLGSDAPSVALTDRHQKTFLSHSPALTPAPTPVWK